MSNRERGSLLYITLESKKGTDYDDDNDYYTTFLSDLLRSQIGNNSYYCIQILQECGIILLCVGRTYAY